MGEKKLKRQEFSRSKKLDIIQEYLTTKLTSHELARKYGIGSYSFIKSWIHSFNVEIKNDALQDKKDYTFNLKHNLQIIRKLRQKIANHVHYFTEAKKKEILKEYLSNDMTVVEVCRKYDIKWSSMVVRWKGIFERKLLKKYSIEKSLNEQERELLDLIQTDKKLNKPRKFTQEFKNSIINEYETAKISQSELGRKYNIGSNVISAWILSHKSKRKNKLETDKIRSNNANLTDKSQVLELHDRNINCVSDSLSQAIMMKLEHLNMSEKERLTLLTENKLLRSKLKELENSENKQSLKSNKVDKLKAEISELEAENYKNVQELENEYFKNVCYNTMIDIAEKELKIEIRKKYAVKQ